MAGLMQFANDARGTILQATRHPDLLILATPCGTVSPNPSPHSTRHPRVTPPSPGPQNNMELSPTGTFTATRPVRRGQELLWRYGIHYWGAPSPLDLWIEAQEAARRRRRP
jgi:hypothetical protein